MSEKSAERTSATMPNAAEAVILRAQPIRAERESVSSLVLQVPVSKESPESRKVGLGKRIVDVTITERDRDRGYAEISIHTYMSCVSYTAEHEWCSLTWVACFDDGSCVEV